MGESGTYQDSIKLDGAAKVLNNPPHTRLREPAPSPDLHRLACDLVRGPRAAHLEQPYRPAKVARLLRVGHVAHLVGQRLKPGLVGLAQCDHARKLLPDHGLVDEPLAEDDALVGPLEAFFYHEAHVADRGAWREREMLVFFSLGRHERRMARAITSEGGNI